MNNNLKDICLAIEQMLSDSGIKNVKILPEVVLEYIKKNNKK